MSLFRAHRSARPALSLLALPAGGRANKLKANRVMKDIIEKRAVFNGVKEAILASVKDMRKEQPETAEYLEDHLVIDEQAMTFMYTGGGHREPIMLPWEPPDQGSSGPLRVMRDIIEERETFNRMKREILSLIEAMREAIPEAAEYLETHLVIDEKEMTFMYTGDDRFKVTRIPPEPSDE
jgi:hypothetical protein